MDQYYVDDSYWDDFYSAYQAQAQIGLEPYYVEGYIDSGYYESGGGSFTLSASLTEVVFVNASAALASEIAFTADAVKIAVFTSTMSAEFTQTSTISHIEGADLVAFAESTVGVDIERIRSVSSEFSAEAALSANVGKIVQLGSAGARTPKTINIFGDAQVSTVQKKFGLGSIAFDGTGDYLTIPSNTDFAYATGTFTIEMWVYRVGGGANQVLLDQRTAAPTNYAPVVFINASNALQYNDGAASVITGATTVPLNAWSHVALSRSGTSTRLFLNGVQQGSTYTDTRNYIQTPIRIGIRFDQSTQAFNGYIDEVRITKGVARYTANFTAPADPFVNDANTVLLIHADTAISDDTGFIPQNVSSEFNFDATTTIIEPAGETVEASGSWTADTAVAVIADKLVAFAAALDAEFSQDAVINKIADVVSTADSAAELIADIDKLITTDSNLTSSFEATVTASAVSDSVSIMESFSETTAIGSVIRGAQAELASEFTQTAMISHIEGADLFAFAEAQLAIQVDRIRDLNIEASSAFDVAIDAVRTVFIAAAADSNAVFDIANQRVRNEEAALSAALSLNVSGDKTSPVDTALASTTSLSATGSKTLTFTANLTAQTQLTADALIVDVASASLTLATSLTITARKTARITRQLVSAFTVNANVSENPNPNPTNNVGRGFNVVTDFRGSLTNFNAGNLICDALGQPDPLVTGGIPVHVTMRGASAFSSYAYLKIKMPVLWKNTSTGRWFNITSTVVYRIPKAEAQVYANNVYHTVNFNLPDIQAISNTGQNIPSDTVSSGLAQFDSNNFQDGSVGWGGGQSFFPNISLSINGITKNWQYVLFCDSKTLFNVVGSKPSTNGNLIINQTGTFTSGASNINSAYTLYPPLYLLGSYVIASADFRSQFTQITTVTRAQLFNVQASASTTAIINAGRILPVQVGTLPSVSQLNAVSRKNVTLSSILASTTQQITNAGQIKQLSAALQVNSTFNAQANNIAGAGAIANSQAQLSIDYIRGRNDSAELTTDTQSTISAVKTTDVELDLTAFTAELIEGVIVGRAEILAQNFASMAIDARAITDTPVELSTTATVVVQGSNIIFAQAQVQAAFVQTSTGDYLRRNEVFAESTANLAVVNTRLRDNPTALSTTTELTADNGRLRDNSAALTVTAEVTTLNQIVRLASANLVVNSEQITVAGVSVRFQANLIVNGFILTAGRILHIDPYNQLRIIPEDRISLIPQETRLLQINSETRVNIIQGN